MHSLQGFVNQCQTRSHWSPPPMSCCSHSDSHKAERSSEDSSRLSWRNVSPSTKVSVCLSGDAEPLLSFPYRVYKYDSVTHWSRWCWSDNQSILPQSVAPSVLLLLDVSGTAPNQKRFFMSRHIIHSIRVTVLCFLLAVDVSDAQRSSGCSSQVPELHA